MELRQSLPSDQDCRANAFDAVDALERALTQVARAMLRMGVPAEALARGEHVDRSGYWALVRLDDASSPLRLSDLAASLELDLSTVSRQVRQLVDTGLVTRQADPDDGRAALVALSPRGRDVLEAVRAARRQVLSRTLADWTASERARMAHSVSRLAADVQGAPPR
jgi:DNA-binding MarR family transcriptional regulator